MKAAVVIFPGSNREGDVARAIATASGQAPTMLRSSSSSTPRTATCCTYGGSETGRALTGLPAPNSMRPHS